MALGPGSETVRAAGGVVTRRSPRAETEVLVVHRPRYDDWSFPKGKVDGLEAEEHCALREVQEETGYRCELLGELRPASYTDRLGRPKTVRYWQMKVASGQFRSNSEVDRVVWLDLPGALQTLSYQHDLALVEELLRQEMERAAALLVRHASAGDRQRWKGHDRLRPLDEKGRRQAMALVEKLLHFRPGRIFSSPYLRCVQTVEPFAQRADLRVEQAEELAEGAGPQQVSSLIRRHRGDLMVLCTHGDVIEAIVGPAAPSKKGGFWLLLDAGDRLEPLRYVAPRP